VIDVLCCILFLTAFKLILNEATFDPSHHVHSHTVSIRSRRIRV